MSKKKDIDMAEISWQNVNAPSNDAVFKGMLLASQGVTSAAESFKDMGTQLNKVNTDVMKQQDEAKSYAIKSLLAGTKNVGEVDAVMPKIQELSGSMNDKGSAGTLISSIMSDAQKQYTARESALTSGFNADKATIEQPLEKQRLQGKTDVGFKNLSEELQTFGLNAGTKSNEDLFKAKILTGLSDSNNQTWGDLEKSKSQIARAEAAAILGITPELANIGEKTVELQVPQAQQKYDIASNAATSDKTKALITGQELEATAAAAKTNAEIAQSKDSYLQAIEAPELRADAVVQSAAERRGQTDVALATHRAAYASSDAVNKFLVDSQVAPEVAVDLANKYNIAVLALKKENKDLDIDHLPLNELKTIIGASNLDPGTWLNKTSSSEIKEQLKKYLESDEGRKKISASLDTDARLATDNVRAALEYENTLVSRKPKLVAQEQEAVKNLETKAEEARLKKEAEIATEGGFYGELLKAPVKDIKDISTSRAGQMQKDHVIQDLLAPTAQYGRGAKKQDPVSVPQRALTPIEILNNAIRAKQANTK